MRKGLGKGKGKGWKNIIASDGYRHELSRRGIKTNQVSLSKSKRRSIKRKLRPLIANHVISGYNIVDNPHLRKKKRYQLVYGHDVIRRHRTAVIRQLKDMGLQYYVLPREAKFLSDDAFIKTSNQVKDKDIISNDHEYQIVIDADSKQLDRLQHWLKKHAVNYGEILPLAESLINPAEPIWEVYTLPKSYTTPDIRIRFRSKYKDFKKADKIVKPLDKNTDLVILSVRAKNTKMIRDALKGEKDEKVLIQDYKPTKNSLYEYIKSRTELKK